MICGGEAQVLMEFVAPDNSLRREIFRRLADLTKNRRIGFLFSDIRIPTGGTGEIRHLFIEDGAAALGGFERADEAVKAMPERRLIKQAQFLNVPGIENPVFLECLRPGGTAYIFGAGHVGVCVAHLASYVDFRVVALDDRAEFASSRRIPDADEVVVLDSFHRASEYVRLDEESYVVIVTRGHAHDQTALRFALRTRAAYIGMIGSRRKTRMIYDALLKEGFTQADLDRVRSPIGLPIGGETPQEIAVSIIAEMIQARTSNA
jgi:xanthine dehydrogenase accessory factor